MDLFALNQRQQKQGGFVTTRMGYGAKNSTALTPTQAFRVQQGIGTEQTQDHWAIGLTKYALAAPVDVADTLASLIPGVKRGATNDAFYDGIGLPGFGQWVRDNQGGVEVASGILGAVATGWAAEAAAAKLVSSAWFASTGIGKAAAPMVNWYANAQRSATQASLAAAKSGKALGWYAGDGTAAGWFAGTNRAFVNAAAARGLAKASVSEIAIAATLHNNSAVWSDDMGTNALFAGLGLGIGGGLATIGARSSMKKLFNSEAYRETIGTAMDPGGYLKAFAETPMTGMYKRVTSQVIPARTAEFTSLMQNARRADTAAESKVLSRPQNQTESEAAAMQVLQTITNRGSEGVPLGGFTYKGTGEGQHILESARRDPTILFGASSVSKLPGDLTLTEALDARKAHLDLIKKNGSIDEIQRAKEVESEVPLVLVNKTWVPAKEAEDFITYRPIQDAIPTTAKGAKELVFKLPYGGKKVFLREDGGINAASGQVEFDKLHVHDQLAVIQASNQLLAKVTPLDRIVVPAKPTFFQLDFAVEASKRGANVDFTSKAGLIDAEAAQILSLQKKEGLSVGMKQLGAKERFALNLPQPTNMERVVDPDGLALRQLMKQASQPGVTAKDLADIRVKAMAVTDLAVDTSVADDISGDVFNFGFTKKGKSDKGHWMSPVIGFFKDVPVNRWTKHDLGIMAAERRASTIKSMMSSRSPLTRMIARAVASHPNFRDVSELLGLADNQIGGTGGIIGAAGSQFLTQAHRFRDNIALLGAQTIRRVVNRMTELHVDEALKRLSPHIDHLSGAGGKFSRVMLNNYLSMAGGWEIRNAKALPGGKIGFVLEPDSTWNATRLGRDVNADEMLKDANGVEVVLDKASNDARVALEAEYSELLKERNAVRRARGLEPVKFKAFYVPAPSTRGKFIGFTLDAANRVIPGGAIVANTREEYLAAAAKLNAKLASGEKIRSQEELRRFSDIWEQAEMDFINPIDFVDPTTLAARSGPQQGKLLSSTINPRAFEDSIQYVKKGYEQVANGVIRNTFDAQLKVARIRDYAMKSAVGSTPGAKSIFETFEETLMGVPASVNPRGVASVMMEIDDKIDTAFHAAWPHGNVSVNHLRDMLGMIGNRVSGKALGKVKDFNDLATALGPHMPFATMTDYAEYKYGLKAPWHSKDVARHVNRLASGIVLRWLEVPHAMMNVAGIITNMPSIMFARNVPAMGRVANVTVPDSMKIMARGLKRSFGRVNGSIDADTQYMIRNGDTSQDVAEIHAQLSLLKGKGSFERFLTGDPKAKSWWAKKGVEGVASVIADSSENWGRRLTHYIGLELADLNGIRGMEARHNFARQVANDSIANYDPLNRPEIFQSAFGSMYGLFLSYAQNYYQRLFRWMEDGDYRAVGSSLAMQSAMFGFMGVPGVRQLANLIGGEEDGDGLVDGIYKRFGPVVGSTVAQGGFNQWITLFGLPPMAMHTRGDASFRHPALDAAFGMGALPVGLEVLKDIGVGTFEAVGALTNPNVPNSGRYAAEVLARQMPSRMLRGTLSVLALGGQEADAYGNLMSETRDWTESAYRMMGVRSARQQAEIEFYFMNQKSLAIDADRMDKVRQATRSLIRDGNYDALPAVFDKYVEAGGKPWNYRPWIKGMIQDANETRGQNQLHRFMKQPGMQDLARRLQWVEEMY